MPRILPTLRRLFAPRRNPWPQAEEQNPWLDRTDAPRLIREKRRRGEIDADAARQLTHWHKYGYVVLENVIDDRRIDRVLNDFEHFYAEGVAVGGHRKPPEKNHLGHFVPTINVHVQSEAVLDVLLDPTVVRWLNLLMGREVYGCQTINFFSGSQRSLHQDHVHMTTRPFGFLAAAWVALEDIELSSGPLVFVPGSQWLPFMNSDAVRTSTPAGGCPHHHMSVMLDQNISRAGLKVKSFLAKKGDVLLWHCNLVHGGGRVTDPARSRLSMACHYAAAGVDYYHEWSNQTRDPVNDLLVHNGLKYLPEYYDDDGAAVPSKTVLRERQEARQMAGAR
jgi:ectoine hydroxylase-related dioxygenase (phytanoyl-CoA dioxygenase family)